MQLKDRIAGLDEQFRVIGCVSGCDKENEDLEVVRIRLHVLFDGCLQCGNVVFKRYSNHLLLDFDSFLGYVRPDSIDVVMNGPQHKLSNVVQRHRQEVCKQYRLAILLVREVPW